MAFDLATAKPVTSKFDLATAKPVEPEAQEQPPPEQENTWGNAIKNVAEGAAKFGTSITGGLAGDVAGLGALGAAAVGDAITGEVGGSGIDPEAVRNKVSGALTYKPENPDSLSSKIVDFPGKVIGESGEYLASKVDNPYLQDIVRAGPLAAAQALGIKAARIPMMNVGAGELGNMGKTVIKTEVPKAAPEAKIAGATAEERAKNYVGSRTNINWASIGKGLKTKLIGVAKRAEDLNQIDPAALERQAQLSSLRAPVPATRGILTRDPVELRNEGNVSATDAGKPIRDIHVAANNALLENLEILKGRTRGVANSPEQVGRSTQSALRGKAETSKFNYDALYKKARETEPNARASVAPVTDLLTSNPEIQHLGWVQTWLNKAAKIAGGKEGQPIAITDATPVELADLRSQASEIARTGGKEGLYAGKVVGAIDQAMETVPESAKAWRAANKAFKAHKTEFAEQGAVEKLVTDKSRTDRAMALEDTWRKTVIGGSIEDLTKVKRSLLTGGDAASRTAGKQAWRDMRAQTIQHIKDEATKSVTRFEDGSPNITPASMERAIRSIGKDKLEEIFGRGTAREIDRVMEATRIVKTEPPSIHKGASTASNIMALLESKLDKVPVIGSTIGGAIKATASLKKIGENGRVIKKAQSSPLDVTPAPKPRPNRTRQAIAATIAAQSSERR